MNRLGLFLARWRFGIQMRLPELVLIERVLRGGRQFLVFGLGNDSLLWHELNRGGRTCFLEDDPQWHGRVGRALPELEAYRVRYDTVRSQWRELIDRPGALSLVVPPQVLESRWDAILVDGPAGWKEDSPGRMKSIFMASRMVTLGGDVLVHDAERPIERAYCDRYLGPANLARSVRGRARLDHYRMKHR